MGIPDYGYVVGELRFVLKGPCRFHYMEPFQGSVPVGIRRWLLWAHGDHAGPRQTAGVVFLIARRVPERSVTLRLAQWVLSGNEPVCVLRGGAGLQLRYQG